MDRVRFKYPCTAYNSGCMGPSLPILEELLGGFVDPAGFLYGDSPLQKVGNH